MMKFLFATLAVLALANPLYAYKLPRSGNGALADELEDFLDLVPLDDMVAIALEYAAEDVEFQKLITVLKSDHFKSLVKDIEATEVSKHVLKYIQNAGLDVISLLNTLHNFIGLPPYVAKFDTFKIKGGIRGFLDEEEALLPIQKIKDLYHKKMATSKVFAGLIAELRKPEIQKFVDGILVNPHFKVLLDMAKKAGVDVEVVKKFLETVLGLRFPLF